MTNTPRETVKTAKPPRRITYVDALGVETPGLVADYLLACIVEAGPRGVTKRDLARHVGAGISRAGKAAALASLADAGHIALANVCPGAQGRPRIAWIAVPR